MLRCSIMHQVLCNTLISVCAHIHLWADDSLDVLQGRVGGGGGAVWCGACWTVVMVTVLPLTHRYMGQVTLKRKKRVSGRWKDWAENLFIISFLLKQIHWAAEPEPQEFVLMWMLLMKNGGKCTKCCNHKQNLVYQCNSITVPKR